MQRRMVIGMKLQKLKWSVKFQPLLSIWKMWNEFVGRTTAFWAANSNSDDQAKQHWYAWALTSKGAASSVPWGVTIPLQIGTSYSLIKFEHIRNYSNQIQTFTSVRPSCVSIVFPSRPITILIPVVLSQNITNRSCLVCVKSEKHAFSWSPSDPWVQ